MNRDEPGPVTWPPKEWRLLSLIQTPSTRAVFTSSSVGGAEACWHASMQEVLGRAGANAGTKEDTVEVGVNAVVILNIAARNFFSFLLCILGAHEAKASP